MAKFAPARPATANPQTAAPPLSPKQAGRNSLGVAIVGCGMIADFHARAVGDVRGLKLTACYDRTLGKAAALAAKVQAVAYDDLDAMLARDDVQIVAVCTASGVHADSAVTAARAGKHVIVEKPLEITLKRCDAIIAACDRAGVKLAVVFPSRFMPASRRLKQAVEQGRFGRITLAEAYVKWHRSQTYYDSGAWRGTWELDGGGALMNQAIHAVDLLIWLVGPVAEVNAQTATLAHERIAVEDVAVATLRFASGALGVIEASTAAFPGCPKRVEIQGSQGSAALEEACIVRWQFEKSRAGDRPVLEGLNARPDSVGGASSPSAISHEGHARQYKDLLAAIREDRIPLIDGRQGRMSVEVILAIYHAAETGRRVALPLTKDPALRARTAGNGGK